LLSNVILTIINPRPGLKRGEGRKGKPEKLLAFTTLYGELEKGKWKNYLLYPSN
jgi:hypothetical protein